MSAEAIIYSIRATDAGASQVFRQTAAEAEKASQRIMQASQQASNSSVESINKLGKLLKTGAGIAGAAIIVKTFGDMADVFDRMALSVASGESSLRNFAMEVTKTVPVVGTLVNVLEKVASGSIKLALGFDADQLSKDFATEQAANRLQWQRSRETSANAMQAMRQQMGDGESPLFSQVDNAIREAQRVGDRAMLSRLIAERQRLVGHEMGKFAGEPTQFKTNAEIFARDRKREAEDRQAIMDRINNEMQENQRRAAERREARGREQIGVMEARSEAVSEWLESIQSIARASRGGVLSTAFDVSSGLMSVARSDRGAAQDPRIDLERKALEEQKKIRENIEAIRRWMERGESTPMPVLN